MIVFQIIWGLILACMLGSSFRRTWNLEHGTPNYSGFTVGKNRGTETVVFFPPTALFWILLIFFIMYLYLVRNAIDWDSLGVSRK